MELLLGSCSDDCAGLEVTDIFRRSLSPEIRTYLKPWEAFGGSTYYLSEIVTQAIAFFQAFY